MKAIWTTEEASYAGRYVNFERIWCWPKPRQQPHPPVLVGGNGPRVLDRVLAYGDEWFPNRIRDEELVSRVAELRGRAQEMGRAPVPVSVMGLMRDPARIERLAGAGVQRGVFWLPARWPAAIEEAFDRYTDIAQAFTRAGG
jgi:alkanesulfonate monooxygenase SsuD/methylene tetrahydromethanopterin reductase-like flavin-dependent oxidoreductase (luciferase family)